MQRFQLLEPHLGGQKARSWSESWLTAFTPQAYDKDHLK
jgi:hypothetical protein